MATVSPLEEVAEALVEAGGKTFDACYQCGLCTATCPWNRLRTFQTRRFIHQAQLGLVDVENEEAWLCTTCGACVERCPRGVAIPDVFRAVRRIGAEWQSAPKSILTVLRTLRSCGNPWDGEREQRASWAADLGVAPFAPKTEFLYFSCCTPAYDPRTKNTAVATTQILSRAGVDFGILGSKESCCGESIRTAGGEDVFLELSRANIEVFKAHDVRKVLVSSPHCYHTLKNEYPALGLGVEVIPTMQFFLQLLETRRLRPTGTYAKKVIYHDPCYLGRRNGVYDPPRDVLKRIPRLELLEFRESRQESLCCGGGGGRIWIETRREDRLSELRLSQAVAAGAEVLAVSCPYCLANLQDSLGVMGKEGVLEIRDVSEILAEVI